MPFKAGKNESAPPLDDQRAFLRIAHSELRIEKSTPQGAFLFVLASCEHRAYKTADNRRHNTD